MGQGRALSSWGCSRAGHWLLRTRLGATSGPDEVPIRRTLWDSLCRCPHMEGPEDPGVGLRPEWAHPALARWGFGPREPGGRRLCISSRKQAPGGPRLLAAHACLLDGRAHLRIPASKAGGGGAWAAFNPRFSHVSRRPRFPRLWR